MAGAGTPEGIARETMVRLIHDAGRIPVERDAFYNPVAAHEAPGAIYSSDEMPGS